MKKAIMIATFTAAFALVALPAFAGRGGGKCGPCGHGGKHKNKCCPEVNIESENEAVIINGTLTVANTGLNKVEKTKRGKIKTGDATAYSWTETHANSNETKVKAPKRGEVDIESENEAVVINGTATIANTGLNEVEGSKGKKRRCGPSRSSGSGSIKTGGAYADSYTMTMVNSNVTKVK